MSFDPSTLSRNFKALRAEGLIHMEHSTEGGYVEISVTAKGEDLFLKARQGWVAAQREAHRPRSAWLNEAIKDAARKIAM